uniref:PDZ domain-containing protein n=1 Tax=Xiphophorus couchianus TaxID=32473 RepID=A0A3B5L7G7_9TELE
MHSEEVITGARAGGANYLNVWQLWEGTSRGSEGENLKKMKKKKIKSHESTELKQSGVIVNTAQDGCAEGLVYGGGGKEGIFIKKVVPESPASKSLKVKEGDQILSATVYFDNMSYEDAIQILEHAQAYKLKLCLKRQPDFTETEPTIDSDVIPVTIFKLHLLIYFF